MLTITWCPGECGYAMRPVASILRAGRCGTGLFADIVFTPVPTTSSLIVISVFHWAGLRLAGISANKSWMKDGRPAMMLPVRNKMEGHKNYVLTLHFSFLPTPTHIWLHFQFFFFSFLFLLVLILFFFIFFSFLFTSFQRNSSYCLFSLLYFEFSLSLHLLF